MMDDCGCAVRKCVDLPAVEDVEDCGYCNKKIAQSMNPANPQCQKKVHVCVPKGAIYQIVEDKSQIVVPEDPSDPTDEKVEEKQDLFKEADEKIIETMEPEEFLKALEDVEVDEPVELVGDKVVVKTMPKEETPEGEEEKPAEFVVKPKTEVEEKPTKKVFVFLPNKCPKAKEETECHF